jgi:hypothetical protein
MDSPIATTASRPPSELDSQRRVWRPPTALWLLLVAVILGLLSAPFSLGSVEGSLFEGSEPRQVGRALILGGTAGLLGAVALIAMLLTRRVGDWWTLAALAGAGESLLFAAIWYDRADSPPEFHLEFHPGPGLVLGVMSGVSMLVASLALLRSRLREPGHWGPTRAAKLETSPPDSPLRLPRAAARWRAPIALWVLLAGAAIGVVASWLPLDSEGLVVRETLVRAIPPAVAVVAVLVILRRQRVGQLWALTAAVGAWTTFVGAFWYLARRAEEMNIAEELPSSVDAQFGAGSGLILGLVSGCTMLLASLPLFVEQRRGKI